MITALGNKKRDELLVTIGDNLTIEALQAVAELSKKDGISAKLVRNLAILKTFI